MCIGKIKFTLVSFRLPPCPPITDYVKTHIECFSTVDCLKAAGIVDQNQKIAEGEFTRTVINMSKWKQGPDNNGLKSKAIPSLR